jgi:threonine/homoserine efflux transporter RhtA
MKSAFLCVLCTSAVKAFALPIALTDTAKGFFPMPLIFLSIGVHLCSSVAK